VKAAAVISAFARRGVTVDIIHTGQHHDPNLSDAFFARFDLPPPAHHLGVSSGTRGEQLGEITARLARLLPTLRLDELIVVGDVTSTAAGALAADAIDVPVAHVEAGLRSFDWTMPEERNRRVVDAIATRLLVSEPSGVRNLEREGRAGDAVRLVGNVMIDTLFRFKPQAEAARVWERFSLARGGYAVATLHRPANVDTRAALGECAAVLAAAAARHPVLFAAHPRTSNRLRELGVALPDSVRVLPPLDYLDFISLMAGAAVVLTDSGGAQEETTALGVPCLTMRENTERPVTCELGTSRLVGRSLARVQQALDELAAGTYPRGRDIPLWDGHAGDRIAELMLAGAS
jgi:UDP-N-acetylglucosamine 2-epimerase (non-hydrolysing)